MFIGVIIRLVLSLIRKNQNGSGSNNSAQDGSAQNAGNGSPMDRRSRRNRM